MPKVLLLSLVLLPLVAWGQAGVSVTKNANGSGVIVTHHGAHPVIALKVGEQGLLSLFPGEAIALEAEAGASVSGRFGLEDWNQALGTLSAPWAEYHLRTAGVYLDTLDPGPGGEPTSARNLVELASLQEKVFENWTREPPLRLALVARAAQHAPTQLLRRVLSATNPQDAHPPWPEAYAVLDSLPTLVRDAIERKGAEAIPALMAHPRWAADRGFSDPGLAWAFSGQRDGVRAALEARTDPGAKAALAIVAQADPADITVPLTAALESDRLADALALAVNAAVRWTLDPKTTAKVKAARLTCAVLDGAAVNTLRRGQYLATEAYLRVAGTACGDQRTYRERVADFLGTLGEEDVGRGDFGSAVGWFRAENYFAKRAIDKARLADTLAEISLLRFKDGDLFAGSTYLQEAQDVDPLRPRVVEAVGVRPKADPRAKLGIFIIIVFLGLFAVRRLRRVWSTGQGRDAQLKRRP